MKMLRLASQGVDFTLSRPKEKWAFAHSFLRVTPQCAEGEAKGQIRLLFKNTPISGEFQRGESHPLHGAGRRIFDYVFAGKRGGAGTKF
jgi:hypothetical protein